MPSFAKGPNWQRPVGVNRGYARSPYNLKTNSHTVAASTITTITAGDGEEIKELQPGTVMAKITSGAEAGKIGPFQPGTLVLESAVITDASTGGTYDITIGGTAVTVPSGTLAAGLLELLVTDAGVVEGDLIAVDSDTGEITLTFVGPEVRHVDVTDVSIDDASATGGTVTVVATDASTTAAGATDGRGEYRNIVGVNDTYLPVQLARRDVEVAVVYGGELFKDRLYEYNGAATPVATVISEATVAHLRSGSADHPLNILCFTSNPEAS